MTNEQVCTREYEFSLVLSGVDDLKDEIEDALFESGCDDATLIIQHGAAKLEFARTALSFQDAVLSAIRDVCRAGKGIGVVQVDECNLVTKSEIARRIDRSRQLVGQYISGNRGPGQFPPPVCYLAAPLWRWCEVSYWLVKNDMIRKEVLMEAEVVSIINNLLERQQHATRNQQLVTTLSQSLNDCG